MRNEKNSIYLEKFLTKIFFLIAIFASSIYSQYVYEMPFVNDNGITKCRRVVVGFKNLVILTSAGADTINVAINRIQNNSFESILNQLSNKYGKPKIIKRIPDAVWGDTVVINRRTGKPTHTVDISQSFNIDFPKPVPLDSVIETFKKLPIVKYAEPPLVIAPLSTTPNDTYLGSQWNLTKINAPKAWDITKGSSSIKAALVDIGATNSFNIADHVDFQLPGGGNKFVYEGFEHNCSSHARRVAGVLGTVTNNNIGIASLSWNTSLMFSPFDSSNAIITLPDAIIRLLDRHNTADVINFSFCILNANHCPADIDGLGDVTDAISRAYDAGVIMIAAAGNDGYPDCSNGTPPFISYPAAYSYNNWVIAVSATDQNDRFVDGYNHYDFIDVAAPSGVYTTGIENNVYDQVGGTSSAAPHVSALAALILSIHNGLTPDQVKTILINSTVKVDQNRHHDDSFGRNDYTGYGRIDIMEEHFHKI